MSIIYSLDGRVLDEGKPIVNIELVNELRDLLIEAEAGRLVTMAGVIGHVDRGALELRFMTHTNNWEIHDRVLARVGVLRTMMENDMLAKLKQRAIDVGRGDEDEPA